MFSNLKENVFLFELKKDYEDNNMVIWIQRKKTIRSFIMIFQMFTVNKKSIGVIIKLRVKYVFDPYKYTNFLSKSLKFSFGFYSL